MIDFPVKFEKRYYQKKFGGKLFTWKELEGVLNNRPLISDKRFNQSQGDFKWTNSAWSRDLNCYPPSIVDEVTKRGVCYISDASRFSFRLNEFARKLEEEYVMPFDAHIYMCRNPNLPHPFGAHFDVSHNLIVQCEGQTNFKVWDEYVGDGWDKNDPESNPLSLMTIEEDPILDVDMNPGDAIWIPRFYPHLATSETKRFSVSFPGAQDPPTGKKHDFEERYWIRL